MHTLPGVRVGALSATAGSNTTGTLHALPSWSTPSHSSSSHATAHRRLLQHSGPAQTALHASLPKVGVVAVPEESLAAARLSQQSQQQQSAQTPRRLQVRRTRLVPTSQQQEDFQQPTALQQQLTDLQLATQQQQQQLWQAQAAAQAPQYQASQYQGSRQQAWSAQYQTNSRTSQQSPSRRSQYPAGRQQRQQYQPRHQQQQEQDGRSYQSYQSDQSTDDWYGQQQGQGQQQQQRTHHQRQGQGHQPRPQQQQWATKPQHKEQQQQQQQSGTRWQSGSGQSDWYQQRPQQPNWQPQQQQQPRQQQYLQRPDQRLSPSTSRSDLSHGAATDGSSNSSQLKFSHGLRQDWSLPTGMAVTYLGSSSGAPTRDRNVSCTVLRLPESMYLVDCGEGSSRQAKLTGLPLHQVETLFITHLHGDHCFGIGTMLVAMCKARKAAAAEAASISGTSSGNGHQLPGPDSAAALRVVGPPRLGELVASMLYIAGVGRQLDQPVYVTEFVETASEAHDWEPLPVPAAVSASSAASRCPAFRRRMAPTQELPLHEWPPGLARRLDRTGLQWQENRRALSSFFAKAGLLWQIPCRQAIVTAAQLQHRIPCWGYVFEERVQPAAATSSSSSDSSSNSVRGRRVVLLGDTVDSRPIAPIALGADLVSHEATFAAGMENKAAVAQHSTAWMAGQFAWAIQAKALVLTHFSARYEGHKDKNKWLSPGAVEGRRGRADASTDADSEERTIKALQREADDQYGLGPVLLAIDLLTAHVPKQGDGDAA